MIECSDGVIPRIWGNRYINFCAVDFFVMEPPIYYSKAEYIETVCSVIF